MPGATGTEALTSTHTGSLLEGVASRKDFELTVFPLYLIDERRGKIESMN